MNKRIWAIVGLAYMVILLGLNFFSLYTGRMVTGIPALMFCPVVAGFAAVAVQNYRRKTGRLTLAGVIVLVAVCTAVFLFCLYEGIPALMRNF